MPLKPGVGLVYKSLLPDYGLCRGDIVPVAADASDNNISRSRSESVLQFPLALDPNIHTSFSSSLYIFRAMPATRRAADKASSADGQGSVPIPGGVSVTTGRTIHFPGTQVAAAPSGQGNDKNRSTPETSVCPPYDLCLIHQIHAKTGIAFLCTKLGNPQNVTGSASRADVPA